MGRGLVLHAALALAIGLEWLLLPPSSALPVSFVTVLVWILCVAFLVTSPRSQWLVRTVFRGPTSKSAIAFTFDDGPDPAFTPRILDVLREFEAKATFFAVGHRVDENPQLLKRALDEGHLLASHSFSHSMTFHFSGARAMADDIRKGIESIERITGAKPRFFRPPQGLRVPTMRDALAHLSPIPVCVTWTARGLDSMSRPAAAIVERLRKDIVPGAIVTLHDGSGFGGSLDRSPTITALRELLELARARGLRCVRLDELLEEGERQGGKIGAHR